MLLPLLLLVAAAASLASASDCVPRVFEADTVVCVCSAEFCDLPGEISTPSAGSHTRITTSRDGLRFAVETGPNEASQGEGTTVVVTLDHEAEYQTIFGFGGAFTDATGFNIQTLPDEAQEWLMRSYFSPEGIEYNLCRIPIAGTDFSMRPYTYDDVEGDVDLVYFNLTMEDYEYKMPYIRRAREMAAREMVFFGSPWYPPKWMKVSGMFNGSDGILEEMWQPWANYLVKFVEAYEAEGISIWGLTPQNEPSTAFLNRIWITTTWSAEDMRDFIKTNLGPALEAANMGHIQLMVLDHNRPALPDFPATIFEDPEADQFVDGVAVHWYRDDYISPEGLDQTHDLFPEKFILYTEACAGWNEAPELRLVLGNWTRAENYATDIIEDLNHWSTGWVDWNMALDLGGGPNWIDNFVDAPIIVDEASGEFYKQPTFYVLGHFSKFVEPGGHRIGSSVADESGTVVAAAFHGLDHTSSTVVVLNRGDNEETVSVDVGGGLEFVNFVMPTKSIVTVLVSTPAH